MELGELTLGGLAGGGGGANKMKRGQGHELFELMYQVNPLLPFRLSLWALLLKREAQHGAIKSHCSNYTHIIYSNGSDYYC